MPALRFLSRPDTAWVGQGLQHPQGQTPLHPHGGLVRTEGTPPHKPSASWYALRFWIELGPSRAWAGSGTRPGAPTRHHCFGGERHQGRRRPGPQDRPRQSADAAQDSASNSEPSGAHRQLHRAQAVGGGAASGCCPNPGQAQPGGHPSCAL